MHPNKKATAGCVFPEEIMTCILTRVPVISIARFKSVCKPWLHLFSNPQFVQMHHRQISMDPKNHLFVVQKFNRDWTYTISLLNAEKQKHTKLDHPFLTMLHDYMNIVGCCNGLVCISRGPLNIALWNPATNMSKEIPRSRFCVPWGRYKASLGFGYDAAGPDYKVVRIVLDKTRVVGVEVYSVASDSWSGIDFHHVGSHFLASDRKRVNDVIVNGNPYWRVDIDGNTCLLGFDVKELAFKVLPAFHEKEGLMFDYCDGRIGALVCNVGKTFVESLDVWVFDDGERVWRKECSYDGVKKAYVDRVLQFSKSAGMVLGVRPIDRVCVFCPETGRDKKLQYAVHRGRFAEVFAFGYTESLEFVRGMKKVKSRGRYFRKDWLKKDIFVN